MSEAHDFNECLNEGNDWEERIAPKLRKQVLNLSVEQISYSDQPEKQLSGIDQVLTQQEINVDVKVRDNKYCCGDVFVETVSVVEENKPGWVYNSATDIIAYCWKNKPGDNLVDGVLLLLDEHFQNWFEGNIDDFDKKYTKSKDNGREWVTKGRIVPVSDIPAGFINTRFDPTQPEPNGDSDQGRLNSFTD